MASKNREIHFQNFIGQSLAARLEMPESSPRAFALFAHCFTCGKDIAAATRVARRLCREGIAVLRFDFTGIGNSDGDFANTDFSTNIDDLIAAAKYLEQEYEAPQLLIGHSLGGSAVLKAATELPSVKGVVTIGAPSHADHVTHLFKEGLDRIEGEGSSTVTLAGREFRITNSFLKDLKQHKIDEILKSFKPALLVLHSPDDEVVKFEHALTIIKEAAGEKSLVSLTDADHLLSRTKDADYVAELISTWAERHLNLSEAKDAKSPELEEGEVLIQERDAKFAQNAFIGNHHVLADEPESVGGTNLGPTPYGYLLTALGTCTVMTIRMYARHKKINIDRLECRLSHQKVHVKDCKDCESSEGKVDEIKRVLKIEGDFDDKTRARLLEIADKCPVHKTLHSEIKIRTQEA